MSRRLECCLSVALKNILLRENCLSKSFPGSNNAQARRCPPKCLCIGNMANIMQNKKNSNLNSDSLDDRTVLVFHSEDEEKLEIVMQIHGSTRTVFRPISETLARSLERIKTNVKNANAKLMKKMRKKMKKEHPGGGTPSLEEGFPVAELYDENEKILDGTMLIRDAWSQAKTLKLCELAYNVVFNPPQVESLKLVHSPLVGMPVHPQIQLKMSTLEDTKFTWYRRLPSPDVIEDMDTDDNEKQVSEPVVVAGKHRMNNDSSDAESVEISKDDIDIESWELVGSDKTYTATDADIGFSLKLEVLPGSKRFPQDGSKHMFHAAAVSATTEGTVLRGPKHCIFDKRILLTTERCKGESFRVVSYNVLADVYANTEYARDFLFPYCPDKAIEIGYRQQLIIKELTGYNADIVCLQEVDRIVFESLLMPSMSLEGYAGAFAAKDGIKEGVAMFYRRDKFRLIMVDNIILRKALREDRNEDLCQIISRCDDFKKSFMSRGTCMLVGLLQCIWDSTKYILLGNTHLYWHPRGSQVRLIQVEVALRELRRLHAEYSESDPETGCKRELTCIITGDFNSHPYSGTVQLLTKGCVPSTHPDWYSMGRAEHISDVSLHNPTKYKSACGFPAYTNFVTSFYGCLDYIFIDPRFLQVERIIPQPTHEEVLQFTALPNETAPSDHIAQVVDLSWIPTESDVNMKAS